MSWIHTSYLYLFCLCFLNGLCFLVLHLNPVHQNYLFLHFLFLSDSICSLVEPDQYYCISTFMTFSNDLSLEHICICFSIASLSIVSDIIGPLIWILFDLITSFDWKLDFSNNSSVYHSSLLMLINCIYRNSIILFSLDLVYSNYHFHYFVLYLFVSDYCFLFELMISISIIILFNCFQYWVFIDFIFY